MRTSKSCNLSSQS